MPAFRVTKFIGEVPRLSRRNLEDNQAQVAVNLRLTAGDVESLRVPVRVAALSGAVQTVYRIEDSGNSYWLGWNKRVNAHPTPIASDPLKRVYYTGDDQPRVTSFSLATSSTPYPTASYALGVPAPVSKPAAVPAGGGVGAVVSRSYVYTYVTQWGEESAPSPASDVVSGKIDDTWTINSMGVAPPNGGSVTAVTANNPSPGFVRVTLDSVFGLRVGEKLIISGVTGSIASYINGTQLIDSVDAGSNYVFIRLNALGTYTSGGTWSRNAQWNTTGMVKYLYRTETGSNDTTFQFVKEVPIASTSTTDSSTTSGEVLVSLEYDPPPPDLHSLAAFPGGVFVGLSGNTVCFSEPYQPHAWPVAYRQTATHTGVALGVTGSLVVVGTTGQPAVLTGADPASMSMDTVPEMWPCLSARGMVSTAEGVMFPTLVGLVFMAPGRAEIITSPYFATRDWELVNPSTFISAAYDRRYYASYVSDDGVRRILILDSLDRIGVTEANELVAGMYVDAANGRFYVIKGSEVFEWDAEGGERLTYDWMSKEFLFMPPINLKAAKLDGQFEMTPDEIAAAQAAAQVVIDANALVIAAGNVKGSVNGIGLNKVGVNGSILDLVPTLTWDSVVFSLYVNNQLVYSTTVSSTRAFRLPAGYKADNATVRLSGNIPVTAVVLGESMQALRQA